MSALALDILSRIGVIASLYNPISINSELYLGLLG
nr:MAG TPA: hypothetical protein [Caudoviricetes sp.]